jgi:hypothetical protein
LLSFFLYPHDERPLLQPTGLCVPRRLLCDCPFDLSQVSFHTTEQSITVTIFISWRPIFL